MKIEELLFDIFDYVSICFNYVLVSCKHFVLSPRCVETTLLQMACSVLRPARLYCEERGNQPSRSYEAGEVSKPNEWIVRLDMSRCSFACCLQLLCGVIPS